MRLAIFSNERMWDLIRHQRSELHVAGLITDDEYAELAKDHSAVTRLEDYDALRAKLSDLEGIDQACQFANEHVGKLMADLDHANKRFDDARNLNEANIEIIRGLHKDAATPKAGIACAYRAAAEWLRCQCSPECDSHHPWHHREGLMELSPADAERELARIVAEARLDEAEWWGKYGGQACTEGDFNDMWDRRETLKARVAEAQKSEEPAK